MTSFLCNDNKYSINSHFKIISVNEILISEAWNDCGMVNNIFRPQQDTFLHFKKNRNCISVIFPVEVMRLNQLLFIEKKIVYKLV